MRIINRYGVFSKHTPQDTRDSLLLAMNHDQIDGVELNLNFTKDKQIIVYQADSIYHHPNHKISQLTLQDLQKYNLGNRVKKHSILTLEKALELFTTTHKCLILNLANHDIHNSEFARILLNTIRNYPTDNIYIKSDCKEIILTIRDYNKKIPLGAVIRNSDPYFWQLNLDFYSISIQDISLDTCSPYMQEQLKQNHRIMIGDIYDNSILKGVFSALPEETMKDIYILTSNFLNIVPISSKN